MQPGSICYIADHVDMHSMPIAHRFLWYNTDGSRAILQRAASAVGPLYAVPLHLVSTSPPQACGSKREVREQDYVDGMDDDDCIASKRTHL